MEEKPSTQRNESNSHNSIKVILSEKYGIISTLTEFKMKKVLSQAT